MPCRVVAKRRQKKGKNRPLFAFCAVLPTEQENTQPALQTLLTNGKIHIVHLLSQQSFHLSVHLLPYKRKPKSTLTAYEKEPHSDVLDRPVIGMWLFRFLIVCTAVFLVMLYARLSFQSFAQTGIGGANRITNRITVNIPPNKAAENGRFFLCIVLHHSTSHHTR